MTDTKEVTMAANIEKILDNIFYLTKEEDGLYHCQIYADYRDEMPYETAIKILTSDNPTETFEETVFEWYEESESDQMDKIIEEVEEKLTCANGPYPDGLDRDQEDELTYYIAEHVCFDYPFDHFNKQQFRCEIMLDTGDGNYDYTLNAHFPCWYGPGRGEDIDDKAGIVWLSKQQGYTREQLLQALNEGDISNPNGFLESVRAELANLPSQMSTLTFLVSLTFEQLLTLNHLLRIRDKDGCFCEPEQRKDVGYIVLGKNTVCGLYDPWYGGGSLLGIELEKDVTIPLQVVRSILPDGGDGRWSVDAVYGLVGTCWKESLKEIRIPKEYKE